MNKTKKLCAVALLLLYTLTTSSQKRELRAVWVATVANIDWPSSSTASVASQKYEFTRLLDSLEATNFNAVVAQIRPTADAFYPSSIEPWSKYLTGKSGRPPEPYFDPLHFMITECHKRNLEFHAWINPLRAYTGSNPHPGNHVTRTHPDWFYTYGKNTIMNAGNPQAINYLMRVIEDIIVRYDIDALHMDDYFYPYTIAGRSIPDDREYNTYNTRNLSRGDWRRDNINKIIQRIRNLILDKNPSIQFGISPFGVWRNFEDDPRGSHTHAGQTNYDNLYADVRLWMQKGWIDYCAPQLYWERGHKSADYTTLLKWWKQNAFDTYIISGLQIYLMEQSSKSVWQSTEETLAQIYMARSYGYDGVCLYSAKYIGKNVRGLKNDLQNDLFSEKALPPIHKHSTLSPPMAPKVSTSQGGVDRIQVKNKDPNLRYVFGAENVKNKFIILEINTTGAYSFKRQQYYRYFVCALNASNMISGKTYL